jgi:hypothetical protein
MPRMVEIVQTGFSNVTHKLDLLGNNISINRAATNKVGRTLGELISGRTPLVICFPDKLAPL